MKKKTTKKMECSMPKMKCGGKTKMNNGGKVPKMKCGGKVKK
jgi:hypothetical protein